MELVNTKKGFIHHFLPLIIIVVAFWAIVGYILIQKGLIKKPSFLSPKKPSTVELKTQYKNPFNKETQYVNPFDGTKNPFAVAK